MKQPSIATLKTFDILHRERANARHTRAALGQCATLVCNNKRLRYGCYCRECTRIKGRRQYQRNKKCNPYGHSGRHAETVPTNLTPMPAGEMTHCPKCGEEMQRRKLWRHKC